MMRSTVLLLLLTATFQLTAKPIMQWSYELKTNLPPQKEAMDERIMHVRQTCMNKAELGEKLAQKKISGISLQTILNGITATHIHKDGETRKLPWFIVLEIQSLARDAYRTKFQNPNDVDDFVLGLYHSCIKNA